MPPHPLKGRCEASVCGPDRLRGMVKVDRQAVGQDVSFDFPSPGHLLGTGPGRAGAAATLAGGVAFPEMGLPVRSDSEVRMVPLLIHPDIAKLMAGLESGSD